MTPSCTSTQESTAPEGRERELPRIALLVSMACVLQVSESMLPHPVPGIRLGLANILTLTALVTLGWRAALKIALLRTLLSSMLMGTFMSPTFILSFSGALVSTSVMALLYVGLGSGKRRLLSIVGVSVMGALAHGTTQLLLAYFLLIRSTALFYLLPWLGIAAVVTGWLNGAVARGICRKIEAGRGEPAESELLPADARPAELPRGPVLEGSFLCRLPAEVKVGSILLLSAAVLIFGSLWLLVGMCAALFAVAALARVPAGTIFGKLKRYTVLILTAFALPLFFNSGGEEVFSFLGLSITRGGLTSGALFGLRIVFLIFLSSLVMMSTAPADLTRALARFLYPLRLVGVSPPGIAAVLLLSWAAFPVVGRIAKEKIKAASLRSPRDLKKLLALLSDIMAGLYLQAERGSVLWSAVSPAAAEGAPQAARTESQDYPGELVGQAAGGLGEG